MIRDPASQPDPAMFPARVDREALRLSLTRELDDAHEALRETRVAPAFDLEQFGAELGRFTFAEPMELDEVLTWTVRRLREGIVQIAHPRYFGLFNPAPGFPAELADQIAAAFNPQLAAAATAPAAVAIEAHVIEQIARRARLPHGSVGHFTNNGTEANFTALIVALTRVNPAYRQIGVRAFRSPPTIYISRDAHLAWIKIAHQAGIGRLAIRQIETDGQGRMSVAALSSAVRNDVQNGIAPVMIVATAGTTVAGMVDPLAGCADIAHNLGIWFHIDAAWGGAAIASDRLRGAIAGIERADSLTIDAHKWFATTMSCGMFLTSVPSVLTETFGVTASFMPNGTEAGHDPFATSVMWSRRFLGLRLFLNLAAAGWHGYAQHVERSVRLIEMLREILTAEGWVAVNPGSLGVLCVEPPDGCRPVSAIVTTIVASGEAWVSEAVFEARQVVRVCVVNGQTDRADIRALARLLLDAARSGDRPRQVRGSRARIPARADNSRDGQTIIKLHQPKGESHGRDHGIEV